ncbi:spinster family MFS transporter [Arenicella xantha]|uniref:Putative MFS family arabinose efflux permease n=1 Tax=Arenicella xantha TaxID=644221 RepID=A0A395JHR8_9GAMM|nr:MFS transporter [Arenicella xantha]RBP49677.1 putative MFS family arabinose efflux permease [Arenicella xantha]
MTKYESAGYRRYVLIILTLVYAVNFIDRQLLTILQESIKVELDLSDLQLGLLTGLAFAIFYVLAGIPIARLAERSSRRNIIAASIGIWSLMTALSGFVANYAQLVLARIGVGIGEAGCSPPAHSMISDMYPPEQRASALSFYSTGINIGIMFGILFGGIINEYFGWRTAFLVVGLPGLVVAVIVWITVQEPIRGWSEKSTVEQEPASFMRVLNFILARGYLVHVSIAAGLSGFVGYSLTSWTPPFFIRSFSMGTAELAWWLAASVGFLGALGTFGWGYLCDRYGQKDKRWYLWLPGLAILLAIIPVCIVFTATDKMTALIANMFMAFFMTGYLGATLAVLHGTVEPRMRATASALYFLVLNIIGLGCGPTFVGWISDLLRPEFGDESLRYAVLYVIPIVCVWSFVHFILAARGMLKANES